jgi:phenylalanyl-tRNA synthetase beta chain
MAARVRRAAIDVGLSEALTFGFCSPRELAAIGAPPAAVSLKNPLTEERNVMRTSLLPGLLEALGRARRHGVHDVRLFATGSRFLARTSSTTSEDDRLPDEVPSFAAVLAGHRQSVLTKPSEIDVYDAKGVIVEIAERALRMPTRVQHQPEERRAPYLHPRAAGELLVGDEVIGAFGPIHPEVAASLDLGGSFVICELDLRAMERIGVAMPKFKPIPTLPAATRDISIVVHDDIPAGAVADAIREAAAELCESVEVFDLFRGGKVEADHRSLAYHVVYRDPKAATDPEHARTLTDEEVDRKHQAVVESVNRRFGAVLRA